jgi:transcription elongation factor
MPWQAAPPRKIELARGDKIIAISGDFDGLTGTVAQAAGDEIMVTIDPHLRAEGIPEEFLFNINDLMKRFDIGDSVVVSRGKEFGNSGIVVAIGDFRAAFLRCARAYSLMPPQTLPRVS